MSDRRSHRALIRLYSSSRICAALILGAVVFLACLLGIFTRPAGFLAAFWPANALMLGLLLRVPAAATVLGWLCAGAGYMAADLLTGSSLPKAFILNAGNLLGVLAAYLFAARRGTDMARLRHPMSMLHLVATSVAASSAAALVGGVANPFLFDGGALDGGIFWFAGEFVNYLAILPVLLSMPSLRAEDWRAAFDPLVRDGLPGILPMGALVLSCGAALAFGGPGAIAFPVPALLWCGLAYPVFPTAILALLVGIWSLIALPDPAFAHDERWSASFRMGVSLIAAAPIMLSCVMQSRNELLTQLRHLATHDGLTGARSRSAFHAEAARLAAGSREALGVLMIDLDHFKDVNDTYGHAGGDAVLAAVARRIQRCLRAGDLFGRLGGEEFAVAISGRASEDMAAVGERIRAAIASAPVTLPEGGAVTVTVSIGASVAARAASGALDGLLADADAALYRAKGQGRNRVVPAWAE